MRKENRNTRGKTSQSREENRQYYSHRHIWRQVSKSNQGHVRERRVLSPPRYHCSLAHFSESLWWRWLRLLKITIFDLHWILITITIATLVRTRLNVTWNPSKGKDIIKTIDRFHEWQRKIYSFVYLLIRPTSLAGALYTKLPVTSLRSKGTFLLHFVRVNEASTSN